MAFLNRIGTAVPPFDIHEAFVQVGLRLLPEERLQRLFLRMAERCQIEHRYSYFEPAGGGDLDRGGFYRWGAFPSTGARMAFYEQNATQLAADAVGGLSLSDQERAGITHLVIASCTGFFAPGLDLQVMSRLGLRSSVERTIVGFMGCYAAMNGLKLARHIVRSEPSAKVLVVNLELCTLHLQEKPDLDTVLTFMLFADGCSAALVTGEPTGMELEGFRAVVIPETEDQITWRIGDQGFDMHLAGAVPVTLARSLPEALPEILSGRPASEVARWAVHPGGRSVLDAVEGALGPCGGLADSRAVLRDHGNMSSASVVFVLKRMLDRFRETGSDGDGLGCAMAFGPGLTAETMTFRMVA